MARLLLSVYRMNPGAEVALSQRFHRLMSASVANLASPAVQVSSAKSSANAGSSAPATGADSLFGPGVSAQSASPTAGSSPAGSTKTADSKATGTDQAKAAANDDSGTSPFAEALAAALGVVLQPNLMPAATSAPQTHPTDGVNADGTKSAGSQPQSAAIATSLIAAAAAAQPSATIETASMPSNTTGTADKTTAIPSITLPNPIFADATLKTADPKVVGAPGPTPSPTPDSTPPVASAQTATMLIATPAGLEAAGVSAAAGALTPDAATGLAVPAIVEAAAVTSAKPPPVKEPQLTRPSTGQAGTAKPKPSAASADPAVESDMAKPGSPTQAAKSGVETVTEKAVAPSDGLNLDNSPPATNKAADLSTLVVAQKTATAPATSDTPKVTTHTVAHLAAQIVTNVDGKSTRFDVTLNPDGLGAVDVRVEIGAKGNMTAQMNFANADVAAQMQSKVPELQAALQQAGFDPSKTTLSFSSGNGQQTWQDAQNQQNQGQPSWTGRAFTTLSDQSDEAVITPSWTRPTSGVDVRI